MRSDDEAKWSELEQAFFDAAPPDEPPAAPARLDDSALDRSPLTLAPPRHRLADLRLRSLTALAAARASLQELVRRLPAAPWFTTLITAQLSRRAAAIGLASALLLMGLSAGVVASLSGGRGQGPVASAAAPATTPAASAAIDPSPGATTKPHARASRHPHARAAAAKHAHHQHRKATGHHAR